MKRSRLACSVLLGLFALPLWAANAVAAPRPESEPRLILPGERTVRAGQLIDLRWSRADAVSELEILLSLDGGRNYSLCISPQLDPDRCDFVWRVPDVASTQLRLRIRFNRGGREIEGSPSAPLSLAVVGRDQPEPLDLPPTGDANGEGAPRRGGDRSESPASEPAYSPRESWEERSIARRTAAVQGFSNEVSRFSGAAVPLTTLADRAPRFVPLRA
jgi:hypothetical protein